MTNREKFKEIYGFDVDCGLCNPYPCPENDCEWWEQCENEPECPCDGWWEMEYKEPIKCAASDAEIAKSFIEDVEAVKDQLPTTKNDLGVDCISREAVERIINKWLSHSDYELKDHIYSMTEKIHNLPSVTPLSSELEKNFGELDCISREAAINAIDMMSNTATVLNLLELPSITPNDVIALEQEPILDKIRAEIAEYGSIWVEYKITGNSDRDIQNLIEGVLKQAKKQVLEIIDKHKAGSEE